jgi:hypothetical protein
MPNPSRGALARGISRARRDTAMLWVNAHERHERVDALPSGLNGGQC